jgi:hypothetical protein
VPAHAGPGVEAHEAVGLGGCRVDDIPDVDTHAVGEHRQLVYEGDVDRAEDVLEQRLGAERLGLGGRGHGAWSLEAMAPLDAIRTTEAL